MSSNETTTDSSAMFLQDLRATVANIGVEYLSAMPTHASTRSADLHDRPVDMDTLISMLVSLVETQAPEVSPPATPQELHSDAELLQDMRRLGVVTIDSDRASLILAQADEYDFLPDRDLVGKRFGILKMLCEQSSVLPDEVTEESTPSENSDEVVEAPLYVPGDIVYTYTNESEEKNGSAEEPEASASPQSQPDLADVNISDSFFNELYPTEPVTVKPDVLGSFPDIGDFKGGIEFVGSGFSGMVFKSTLRGLPVVLKVSKEKSERANRADYSEWSISERLNRHPNVLRMIGLCPSFSHPDFKRVGTTAIISPWQENQGLRSFYDKRSKKDGDLENAAFGMIQGIRSLHEQRVIHRDIAVRNFLVDNDGRVLLCDFGLTIFLPEGEDKLKVDKASDDAPQPWRYLAPESFDGTFSTKSDIWMYGLALLELVSNKHPWDTFRHPVALRSALQAQEVKLPNMENLPPVIANIVRDCLQFDASARPTAGAIAERLVKSQFAEDECTRDESGNTDLHRWVLLSSRGEIKCLQESCTPTLINAVNSHGETPLMMAKRDDIRKQLLSFQKVPCGNIEPSRDPQYFHNIDISGTLLKLAQKEDLEGIKSIGKLGLSNLLTNSNKPMRDVHNETPLHIAAKSGNAVLLDALINLYVFNICGVDHAGQTALHIASAHGHVEVMRKLLCQVTPSEKRSTAVAWETGKNSSFDSIVDIQDNRGKTSLHLAALNCNVSATKFLLQNSTINVNSRDASSRSPLFDSIHGTKSNQEDQLAVLKMFIARQDVNVNTRDATGETLLHKIAREDFVRAADVLLGRADLKVFEREKEHGFTPLHLAVRELSVGMVEILSSREDVDVNEPDKYGNTPLHILAKVSTLSSSYTYDRESSKFNSGTQIVKILLSRADIQINRIGVDRNTPLHDAADRNNTVVAKELVSILKTDVCALNDSISTPLHCAARSNSVDVAKLLLSRDDVDVNARDEIQCTPLHRSVFENSVEVAELLLSRDDVDVHARSEFQMTPLHKAAMYNNVEPAKLLLSREDVGVESRSDEERTPLHLAALHNSVEVAKLLLSRKGVDVNARDVEKETPLHQAAIKDSFEVARLLLMREDVNTNACDKNEETPLHYAASFGNVEIAKLLLSQCDVDANARDEFHGTPLHSAAMKNTVEVAELLLSSDDVEINARDEKHRTPLHIAADYNSIKVAELLLSQEDVDVDVRDEKHRTPLHAAVLENSVKVAELLLSREGVDVNARDTRQSTPLHSAAYQDRVEIAKLLLLREDVDVNAQEKQHLMTPLHLAACKDSVEVAKLLLSHENVSVDARSTLQLTPLHIAAHYNSIKVAELLLLRDDVDANARNKIEQTPLHKAALHKFKSPEVAKLLLSRSDVDANARDKCQRTSLHMVAFESNTEFAKLLLSRDDVDTSARDHVGKTALDIAVENGAEEVIELLRAKS